MSELRFPFIGAGDAQYFEWAEMFVAFAKVPAPAAKKAIAARVPPPLRDTIEWNGRVLWVASEQGVGRLIEAAYGKRKSAPKALSRRTQFTIARPGKYAAFNADIDAWLGFADAKAPILVAFRREDAEAGGTALSDWHRESLAALPKVLAILAKDQDGASASLGVDLLGYAKGKGKVDAALAKALRRRAKDAEEEVDDAAPDWDALAAVAKKALGAPAPKLTKKRTAEDLALALDRLVKVLPATAKRLRAMAKKGLALRNGASSSAIAAAEKAVGVKFSNEHRALLAAFDGGEVGAIVLLGTAAGGSVRDAELAAFNRAWTGTEENYVVVAHTKRNDVVVLPRGASGPASLLSCKPGWGGGMSTRQCKSLDIALDAVLKAGRVFKN